MQMYSVNSYFKTQHVSFIIFINYFQIVDNYKWMESPDSELTQNFVKAQNELSFPYLKNQCPAQPKFEKKLVFFKLFYCVSEIFVLVL